MVLIKRLETAAIECIGEVDRRERVTLKFTQQNGKLIEEVVDWNIPRWKTDGSRFSTQVRINKWKPILEDGGAMFGAIDDDANLCGFAVVNPKSIFGIAELAALFIGKDWRRQGIGKQLTAEAYRFAQETGAENLFVSANDSEAAVRFYLKEGFDLAENVYPELYKKLYAIDPEGIHFVKSLGQN